MAIQKPNLCKLFEHYGQYLSQTFTIVMNITGNIGARHLLVLGITLAVLILTYKNSTKAKAKSEPYQRQYWSQTCI